MTYLEVAYHYRGTPTENAMRAIDGMREVYGILVVQFNEQDKLVKVRFDASRMKDQTVAGLLRRAGIDVGERLALA